jgi:peptidoglycan hydrolase-like protein with peptidoglycan-binding domain
LHLRIGLFLAAIASFVLGWAAGSVPVAAAVSATVPAKKPAAKKKSAAARTTATPKTTAKKTAPARTATTTARKPATHTTARKGKPRPAPRAVSQRQPAPERYKEIQEALAKRGYFQGSPDGVWGPSSVDAMRRFQQEQNLDASGKINSLSLIALGLGPKYDQVAAAPVAGPDSRD